MTTRSPLARDEYDRVPENSGGDTLEKTDCGTCREKWWAF